MLDRQALLGVATALGSGLLIGIERERRKGTGPHRAIAGLRTFTLAALTGAAAHLSGHPALVFAGALLIASLAALGYWRERSRDPGITTEVALLATYIIGVLAVGQPTLAAGCAVVITALLAARTPLHRFAVRVLSQSELRDAILFAASALIILPLLPESPVPWLPSVNPQKLWSLVIVFMALQGVGYIALRAAGPALGLSLSGLASGFVSSTATVAAFGARARATPTLLSVSVAGALFSSVATVLLLGIVILAVNPAGLRWLGASLGAGLLAALLTAHLNLRARPREVGSGVERGRAFNLAYAIGFALTLTGLTAGMTYLTGRFGALALPLSAALAGLFDLHASAASVLAIAKSQSVAPPQATFAILCAVTTNTLSKVVAAFAAGGFAYGLRIAAALSLVVLSMWAPWVLT